MKSFSVKSEFGKEIEKIWLATSFDQIDIKERGYAVQNEIVENALLFVGINPSFSGPMGNIFYDNNHGNTHKYFKKFIEISQEVGLEWAHIDLLFVRETKQQIVKDLEKTETGRVFVNSQLNISKAIIEKANPKIIVVNNTYARNLLLNSSIKDIRFSFDNELGTERISSNNSLNGTPIFFTSMLTGQRAMDLGSFRRLVWHLKFVLQKIK